MHNNIKNSKLTDTVVVISTPSLTPPEDFLEVNEEADIKISINNSSLCVFKSADLGVFQNDLKK